MRGGWKDCESLKTREFVVSLCLLIMSETTSRLSHRPDHPNRMSLAELGQLTNDISKSRGKTYKRHSAENIIKTFIAKTIG